MDLAAEPATSAPAMDLESLASLQQLWGKMDVTTCELVQKYRNLNCEPHEVETSDGYIVTLFRVNKKGMQDGAKPVFMQHGLFGDSNAWVRNGAGSPGIVLANEGYDVWVGNNRGNRYARKHTQFDT